MSPAWLPPLDSHEEYLTAVRIDEADNFHICRSEKKLCEYKQREGKGEHKGTVLCVQFKCTVRFFPKDHENFESFDIVDEDIGFPGLLLDKWFEFDVECSRREDLLESCNTVKEFIKIMLQYFNISWKLYPICFLGEVNGYNNYDYFLEDEHNLAHAIISVLLRENTRCCTDFIPLRLHIFKHVCISDDEYSEWSTWFLKKTDVDSKFGTEYLRAIRRPRTIDELLYEMQMKKFKSASESFLRKLEVTRNFDSKSIRNCLICLENISEGSLIVNLPCSHVFHKLCILKWLQQSHFCPLCRFCLPTSSSEH